MSQGTTWPGVVCLLRTERQLAVSTPGERDTQGEAAMGDTKSDWIASFFDQIESQVQFGDTKASLLVAGDSILT